MRTLLILLVLSVACYGASTTINFDNLADGTVVTNQYAGVVFSSVGGTVNVTLAENLGTSLPNFICTGTPAINCTGETILTFSSAVANLIFKGVGINNVGTVASVDIFENGGSSP